MKSLLILAMSLGTLCSVAAKPLDMVLVEAGTFEMGSENEKDSLSWPRHQVTLSSFYIGKFEVTQKLYTQVMGKNPSRHLNENFPVEWVTWFDACSFCNVLSVKEGLKPAYQIDSEKQLVELVAGSDGYRLPTEAQWEFAARGGQASKNFIFSGSNNIDEVAWYDKNSGGLSHEVGTKAANELGIHDMSGNVIEWTFDSFGPFPEKPQVDPVETNPSRGSVLRGGGFSYSSENSRIIIRFLDYKYWKGNFVGFRLVLPAKTRGN